MVLQDVYYNGNKKIDDLIRKMQLKINNWKDIVFEWIPYNQFSDIKEIDKGGFSTVYSAIWANSPLEYGYNYEYTRRSYKKVALKCLYNSQNITSEFLNEVCNFYNFKFKFKIIKIF